jgi:periplasmic protein TonB
MNQEDEEELGFYRRYRYLIWLGVAVLLVAPITLAIRTLNTEQRPPKAAPINFVKLLPPVSTPTPPPPTPQSTPRPQEKMLEQKHMDEPETKPQHPDEKPKDASKKPAAPGPSGPNSTSQGPANGPGWLPGSGGGGGGGGGGTRFGWYAAQVQSRIEEALHQNTKTKSASISGIRIRIWVDNTARVTRAQLVGSTGDPSLDSAITNEVLTGLQLKEPPPSDMPMPIVLRVTAHRPIEPVQ